MGILSHVVLNHYGECPDRLYFLPGESAAFASKMDVVIIPLERPNFSVLEARISPAPNKTTQKAYYFFIIYWMQGLNPIYLLKNKGFLGSRFGGRPQRRMLIYFKKLFFFNGLRKKIIFCKYVSILGGGNAQKN